MSLKLYLSRLWGALRALEYIEITAARNGDVEILHIPTGSTIAFFPDGTIMTQAATDNWQRSGRDGALLLNSTPEFKYLTIEEKRLQAVLNARRAAVEAGHQVHGAPCRPTS